MRAYHFDPMPLRSHDPDAMGSPGTLYLGQMRVTTKGGGSMTFMVCPLAGLNFRANENLRLGPSGAEAGRAVA